MWKGKRKGGGEPGGGEPAFVRFRWFRSWGLEPTRSVTVHLICDRGSGRGNCDGGISQGNRDREPPYQRAI